MRRHLSHLRLETPWLPLHCSLAALDNSCRRTVGAISLNQRADFPSERSNRTQHDNSAYKSQKDDPEEGDRR